MWFSNLFKKDNNMQNFREPTKGQRFKWIKGEKFNEEVTFKEFKDPFLIFDDGSKCNKDLIDDYIVEIEGNTGFNLDIVSEIKSSQKVSIPSVESPSGSPKELLKTLVQPQSNAINPLHIILDKQKIKPSSITIELNLKIPKQELIELLQESFDDVDDSVANWIIQQINLDLIKDSIKKTLKTKVKRKIKTTLPNE